MNFSYSILKSLKYQESKYQDIIKSWSDVDFNKSTAGNFMMTSTITRDLNEKTRSKVYTNAIQFQIKKTIGNSRSIRLTRNQSEYIVSTTFQQHVDFAKIDQEENNHWIIQQLNQLIISRSTSHRIVKTSNQTTSNKQ